MGERCIDVPEILGEFRGQWNLRVAEARWQCLTTKRKEGAWTTVGSGHERIMRMFGGSLVAAN